MLCSMLLLHDPVTNPIDRLECMCGNRWCLLELHAAVKAKVPIIVLRVANAFAGDVSAIPTILTDLTNYLNEKNPLAEETLRAFDLDAKTVGEEILAGLLPNGSTESLGKDEIISFDSHQSSSMLQSQCNQLAAALVEKACPENRSLLRDTKVQFEPWPVTLEYAVYIIHEEQTLLVIEQARAIKRWLVENSDLKESQIVLQIDAPENNRALNDVSSADMVPVANSTDSVLLLQSANVMREPRCIAKLCAVCQCRIPIVPVVLLGSKVEHEALVYDFATAKPMMENLADSLGTVTAALVTDATSTPVGTVGLALSQLLPNIISKPLGIDVAAGEVNAQMAEIELTLRRSIAAGRGSSSGSTLPQVGSGQNVDLTVVKVPQLRAAFQRVDANGDGVITRDEIIAAIRQDAEMGDLLGLGGETGDGRVFEVGRLFQQMDTDGDHSIDVDEFIAFFRGSTGARASSGEHDVEAGQTGQDSEKADQAQDNAADDWKAERKAELVAELERVRNGQPAEQETLIPSSESEDEGIARP